MNRKTTIQHMPSDSGMLCKLFVEHAGYVSDKWEHYLPVYQSVFAGLIARGQPVRLLEIGVQNGGSLQIWSKYLPEGSTIVGIDIDPACASLVMEPNISVWVGDATSRVALHSVLGEAQFDVIIDDGSHRSDDIISTFRNCWERLTPGGIYVVEDLHCSYWKTHGGGFRQQDAAIEHFKDLVDALNADHFASDEPLKLDSDEKERLQKLGKEIARISFFDSLVVVERLNSKKQEPYSRVLTGREAHVFDLVGPIAVDPVAIRKLLLSYEAAISFTPALLDRLATAREELGQSRAELAQRGEKADALRAEMERQSREAEALRAEVERQSREAEALRAEVAQQSREAEALRAEVAGIAKLEEALDGGEKLIGYAADRYTSAVRKRRIKALQIRLRLAFSKSRVRRKLYEQINDSVFFDRRFYLDSNPDVRAAQIDPVVHYLKFGSNEGRDSSPYFSEAGYRRLHSDVASKGLSAIEHYEKYSRAEGRGLLSSSPGRIHAAAAAAISLSARADWPTLNALLSEYFNAEWYRAKYPDIQGTDMEVYEHFVQYGAKELRNPCGEFESSDYLDNNQDVQDIPIVHYLLLGRSELRSPKNFLLSEITGKDLIYPLVSCKERAATTCRVCCLLHIYYVDLVDELLSYAENIKFEKDVIVNLVSTTWTPQTHSSILKRFPNAKIIISPDLGRDIGGLTRLISAIDLDQYDIFFFAHSKKSPHTPEGFGVQWRRELLEPLVGTPQAAERCVLQMRDNNRVGLVGSRKWRNTYVLNNLTKYNELLDIALIRPENRQCEYISGTMFFITQRVIRRLYTVIRNIQYEDGHGADLSFHIDGQYAHAVERLIGNLVRDEDLLIWYL